MKSKQPHNLSAVAALLCASEKPLTGARLAEICECSVADVSAVIEALPAPLEALGLELVKVASGYRIQTKEAYAERVGALFTEASPRFTRATLETLALIAYRQPITRGEIEHIRSVSVSSGIMRSLTERGWIRIIGHRDVPGKPALYGTTSSFLDYFNLSSLAQLPVLPDVKSIDDIDEVLNQLLPDQQQATNEDEGTSLQEHKPQDTLH